MTNKCGSCGSTSNPATSKFCTQCGNKLSPATTTTTSTPSYTAPKVKPLPSTTTTTSSPTTTPKPRPVSTYVPNSSSTSPKPKELPKTPITTSTTTTTTTTTTSFTPKSILKPVSTSTASNTGTLKKPLPDQPVNRPKSHTVNYGKESPVKSGSPTIPKSGGAATTDGLYGKKEWSPGSGGSFVKMAAKSRETLDSRAMRDSMILSGQDVNTIKTPVPATPVSSKSSLNISHKKAVSAPEPTSGAKVDKQRELEKQIQAEKEKFQQKEKEIEKQRQLQLEKEKEADRVKAQAEKEKIVEKEREKEKEKEKQAQTEREKLEKEKQKQIDKDRQKQAEKEKEREKEKEKEKEKLAEKEKMLEKEKEKEKEKQAEKKRQAEKEREKERDKLDREREKSEREREKLEKEREKMEKEREKMEKTAKHKSLGTSVKDVNGRDSGDDISLDSSGGSTPTMTDIKGMLNSSTDSNGNGSAEPKRKTRHGSRFFSFILGDKDEEDIDSLQISSPSTQNISNTANGNGRDSLESSNNSVNSENANGSADDDTQSTNSEAPLRKWAMKRNELQTSNSNLLTVSGGGSPSSSPVPTSPSLTQLSSSPSTSSSGLMLGSSRISAPEPPPALIDLPQATDHRSKVIEEIIITENDYIRDLEIMCWLKREMMKQDEEQKLNSSEDINSLFSNVEQLLLTNKELYHTFVDSKYKDLGDAIAFGFKMMSAFLKSYSVYCSNQQKAIATFSGLRGKNASYLAYLLTRRECRNLPFDSFLIKPIQRVCKYPLLIRELIKSSGKESKSHEMLLQAQSAIESIVMDVNEKKKEYDSQVKMFEIQQRLLEGGTEYQLLSPSRRLIKEGPITTWGFIVPTQTTQYEKKPKDGYYFLFNDLFLYTTIKSGDADLKPLKLKAEIPLKHQQDSFVLAKDISEPSNSIEIIYSTLQIWMFSLSTPEEKQALFTEIGDCIETQMQLGYKKYVEEKQNAGSSSPVITSTPSSSQSTPPIANGGSRLSVTPKVINGTPSLSAQVESYDEWRKLVRNKPLPTPPPIGSPSINRPPPKVLPPPPVPSSEIKL